MPNAIACPGCLKRFAWTPKIAGKRVTCHCGQKFITPEVPGGDVIPIYETKPAEPERATQERETYDLADDLDAGPGGGSEAVRSEGRAPEYADAQKCPDCNAPVNATAVVCVRCGFDLSAGRKLDTAVGGPSVEDESHPEASDAANPVETTKEDGPVRSRLQDAMAADLAKRHKFRDWQLPAAVLTLGLALALFNVALLAPWSADAALWAPSGGGDWGANAWAAAKAQAWVSVLVGGLAFVGRLMCAWLLGADFGALSVALLKLSAFTLGFVGLASVAYYGLNMLVAGVFTIALILWIAAATASYLVVVFAVWDDTDQSEAGLLLAVIGVGYLLIEVLAVPVLMDVLGFA